MINFGDVLKLKQSNLPIEQLTGYHWSALNLVDMPQTKITQLIKFSNISRQKFVKKISKKF